MVCYRGAGIPLTGLIHSVGNAGLDLDNHFIGAVIACGAALKWSDSYGTLKVVEDEIRKGILGRYTLPPEEEREAGEAQELFLLAPYGRSWRADGVVSSLVRWRTPTDVAPAPTAAESQSLPVNPSDGSATSSRKLSPAELAELRNLAGSYKSWVLASIVLFSVPIASLGRMQFGILISISLLSLLLSLGCFVWVRRSNRKTKRLLEDHAAGLVLQMSRPTGEVLEVLPSGLVWTINGKPSIDRL